MKEGGTIFTIITDLLQAELFHYLEIGDWEKAWVLVDKYPGLARCVHQDTGRIPLHCVSCQDKEVWSLLADKLCQQLPEGLSTEDDMGMLPIHHAAGKGSLTTLKILHDKYPEGVGEFDRRGRLPIHVAAESHSVENTRFLLDVFPTGSFALMRPLKVCPSPGGLALHAACRSSSSGIKETINLLLGANCLSAQRLDENGDLPIHVLLRCGKSVDEEALEALIVSFPSSANYKDSLGSLPLCIALRHACTESIVRKVLNLNPDACWSQDGDGCTPLHLALVYGAGRSVVQMILDGAPGRLLQHDPFTGLLPIQVALQKLRPPPIVHDLLLRDLPIDILCENEARIRDNGFSWHHVLGCEPYYLLVIEVIGHCSFSQAYALATAPGPNGRRAIDEACPLCKHALRVKTRLFGCLEIENATAAFSGEESGTELFYGKWFVSRLDVDTCQEGLQTSLGSLEERLVLVDIASKELIQEAMRVIKGEDPTGAVVKFTSQHEVMRRELTVRAKYQLSGEHVCRVLSLHSEWNGFCVPATIPTALHCIVFESADSTLENLLMQAGKGKGVLTIGALKDIGLGLKHIHDRGLVHGDFGKNNVGKFGSTWKVLAVGGAQAVRTLSDPNRGFYLPPEAFRRKGEKFKWGRKKQKIATVVPVELQPSFDIFAFGALIYEVVTAKPFTPRAVRCGDRGTVKKSSLLELDDLQLRMLLRGLDPTTRDLLKSMLHWSPAKRYSSMEQVVGHAFFADDRKTDMGLMTKDASPDNGQNMQGESSPLAVAISFEEGEHSGEMREISSFGCIALPELERVNSKHVVTKEGIECLVLSEAVSFSSEEIQ